MGAAVTMIKGVIIVNNHGKPRLVRFYEQDMQNEDTQQACVREIFNIVSKRSDYACNFVETTNSQVLGSDTKIVYRHYATLYFILVVDSSESELGILDLVQVFVETLDKNFENVCELDLIFHHDKVHFILDEIIMGGMVLETNINEIIHANEAMNDREGTKGNALTKIGAAFSRK